MASISASEEPEPLDDLPPLDPEDERDEPLDTPMDLDELEDTLDPDADVDLDDEGATDLDVGIAALESEEPAGDDRNELVLDIAELLAVADEETGEDDAAGPPDFDPSVGLEESAPPIGGPDEEVEHDYDGIVDEELPGLDADDEGDFDEAEDWVPHAALDEPPPSGIDPPWLAQALVAGERVDVVMALSGLVVSTGASVHCFGKEQRRLDLGARVTSAALSGGMLLMFTATGQLLRRDLVGDRNEELEGWREAAGARRGDALELELSSSPFEPGVVLARTNRGGLLRSVDRGTSFSAEDLHARVLGFDAREKPAVLLAETTSGKRLLSSDDGGSSWSASALDEVALAVADGAAVRMAALDDVVALGDLERGLAVSSDGGKSFFRVPGSARLTALCAARLFGEPVVFAALHRDTDDRVLVCMLDVTSRTFVSVAELAGDESSEDARALSLVWDADRERLLVGGGFGLSALSPASSPA